jgi:hypothetical protein
LLGYFVLLGVGFLLAEVALQQRFKLLLGDPVLSMAATVGGLLMGSGAGSLFGRRFSLAQLPRAAMVTAAGAGVCLLASVVIYPALVELALPAPLPVRVGVTLAATALIGCFMGGLFPGGLRLADDADPAGIPLFWGMNALASTVGAVLATVFALAAGFHVALAVGGAIYLGAALLVRLTWPQMVQGTAA